jgi:hypothetical protein
MSREPAAAFVVLVGNMHARKRPHPEDPTQQQPMASLLVAAGHEVTSLDARRRAARHSSPAVFGLASSHAIDYRAGDRYRHWRGNGYR